MWELEHLFIARHHRASEVRRHRGKHTKYVSNDIAVILSEFLCQCLHKNNNCIIILIINSAPETPMDINDEIKQRVFSTADRLYAENDRSKFPTVDEVRRAAKTDMNAASVAMKEWRRQQTTHVEQVAVSVPQSVNDAFSAALASAWQAAVAHANKSLDDARSAWDAEKKEAEEHRTQLATAYDNLHQQFITSESELHVCTQYRAQLESDLDTLRTELEKQAHQIADLTRQNEEKKARIEELKSESADQRQQHREEISRLSEHHERELKELTTSLENHRKDHEQEVHDLITKASKSGSRAEQLDSQLAALQDETIKLNKAKNSLDTEVRELRARLESAAREVTKAETRSDRLEQQLIDLARHAQVNSPKEGKSKNSQK